MSWTDKTTLANFVAAIVVVGGMGYAIYMRDTDLVKSITLFGLGWFFGAQTIMRSKPPAP